MNKYSVNKAIVIGRLGQKPELKYTQSEMAVANVSLATTESVKKGGEYQDVTEWHRVVVFGKSAEFMANYLDKGAMVYIEGRLQTRSWESDGVKKYTTEIVAHTVTPLGSNSKGEVVSQGEQVGPFVTDEVKDELPF